MSTTKNSRDEEMPTVEVTEERQKQHMRKWDMTVYVVIMILVLGTLGQAVISYRSQHEQNDALKAYVKCQADWTNFLYKSTAAGRQGNQNTQKALDDLVNAVASAKSPAESRAALDRYKQARAEQIAALEQNPLPPPPDQVCELDG
jgi:hypothetical protein